MWKNVLVGLGYVLLARSVTSQWSCTLDEECGDVTGSVCSAGACLCPIGQQIAGTRCADLAPYHTSACFEDHQCSRMFSFFECRKTGDEQEGGCHCQNGYHYFLGRCWRSIGFREACTRDEECFVIPRDPYGMRCDGTCRCAEGYYERQRGECRKIAYAVGDGCVLDQDCQFTNGICDLASMTCGLSTASRFVSNITAPHVPRANVTSSIITSARATRQHGSVCSAVTACDAPFECSTYGVCVCPVGYYASADGVSCFAELGSVSTVEQCVGLLAVVVDGICTCPPNFFYEENMRHCVKVTRRITDSCVNDENCHTFGSAARCGEAALWGLRSCECDLEQAVWDSARQMCRLFAGIGEICEVDSDCLAGELEIQCAADETGQGYCVCPDGYLSVDGLCLTTGLVIGDACQATQECTETENSACVGGVCACDNGYQLMGEDYCAPSIGGTCIMDSDCVIENTICQNDTNVFTCQCNDDFVEHNDTCWPVSLGFGQGCNNTAQCAPVIGEDSLCAEERCVCQPSFHFREGHCWPITNIFESCSRTSVCYLSNMSERVVCRNGLCQCDFDFPYSEEEHTCLLSSASSVYGSTFVIITSIFYLFV